MIVIGNVYEGEFLRDDVCLVDDVHDKVLVESVLLGHKFLELGHLGHAGAVEEATVLVLLQEAENNTQQFT